MGAAFAHSGLQAQPWATSEQFLTTFKGNPKECLRRFVTVDEMDTLFLGSFVIPLTLCKSMAPSWVKRGSVGEYTQSEYGLRTAACGADADCVIMCHYAVQAAADKRVDLLTDLVNCDCAG
ncbi:hypothetical protein EVAR_78398_1 [Eumeta japonica]|uniref:Uncharacterized protein n=1 Tax=Eumeta variegata TaxID=151549 RepID=A0A4C1T4D4_EUMVA|nr:hypothetical protein EVAR_78398_1 [Eumeta japonica]